MRARFALSCAVLALTCSVSAWAQFGQNKVTHKNFKWQVYRSPHFNIHYYPEMEPFLEEVVSYAESAYLKISRDLDHELRFRVPLVVYRTHGEFQQTNILLSEIGEGTGAFAEPIQNRMVLPIDLPPDKLYELIAHELVHIFEYSIFYDGYIGRALRSRPPTWLMEGLASYLADDEDSLDQMWIRDAVVNGVLPPIQNLNVSFFLQYRYGHAIFDFIVEEHGPEGLRTFLFEFRKVLLTGNLQKAIKESFGYDIDAFNRNFDRYLRRKYYPVLLEKKSPDDYGKEIGVKGKGLPTYSPAISPSGELVAALGYPGREQDLLVLSVDGGKKVKNLTKGYTNHYRYLVAKMWAGKRDLSWSPTADEVAVFARREDKWPLLVFNAVNGKRVNEIRFKDIVQCSSPAFSPDGKRIAFEGNQNGVVDIFEVDLETKEVRNLTQDDFFDSNPWYAPDGKTLIYNRRIGSHWKVFTVDLSDSEKKSQLTFGRFSDIQPSLSRDGQTVYFSSDRGEHGVFNLFSLDLTTAEAKQLTDVVGGCFAPVEMAERSGDRNLVFTSVFEGTFRLYRMPLKEPEATISAEQRFAEPLEAEPFEPPLSLRVDEDQKRKYKLKWDIEAPYLSVGVTNDGTFLADAAIGFSDLMGNHRMQIIASTVSDFANFNFVYFNLKRRFNWGTSVYDYRDYFLRATSSGTVDRDQTYRLTGANGFIHYPLSRYYRIETEIGAFESSQDVIVGADSTGAPVFQNFTDRFGSLNVALVGDTTRYQQWYTIQGKRLRISTWAAPHVSGDDPNESGILEHRLDFRAYKQLTRRSVLAFRAASIYNTGEREYTYGFGGINQLRGYDFREFIGSRMAWSNLELRFPLIDFMTFPLLGPFVIRGVAFVDAGAAWLDNEFWFDPFTGRIRLDALTGEPIKFRWWNKELDMMQDLRASYGVGFNFLLFRQLQLNWIWARPTDYAQYRPETGEFEEVKSATRQEFYIVHDW